MMVEIDTLFQTKSAKKPYPLAGHTVAYMRDYPAPPSPPAKTGLQIVILAAYTSETDTRAKRLRMRKVSIFNN